MIGPPGQEQVYALASADRPYRLIVEAMNEGAATISPRGVILDVNPRLTVMTGQPGAQLIGASVLNLVPGACRPELTRLLDVGAGASTRGEVDLTGPDGSTVPVLLAVSGFDLDGMLLRCLVLTDLTAQRAAEDRAAQAHEALREQSAVLERAQESWGWAGGSWTRCEKAASPGRRRPTASSDWPRPSSTGKWRRSSVSSTRTTRRGSRLRLPRRWRAAVSPPGSSTGSYGPTARSGGCSRAGSWSGTTRARDGCWESARTSPTGSGSRRRIAPRPPTTGA